MQLSKKKKLLFNIQCNHYQTKDNCPKGFLLPYKELVINTFCSYYSTIYKHISSDKIILSAECVQFRIFQNKLYVPTSFDATNV